MAAAMSIVFAHLNDFVQTSIKNCSVRNWTNINKKLQRFAKSTMFLAVT